MKKCMCATLESFIHAYANTKLGVYHCSFEGIAAYLINNKQLSEKDAAHCYWFVLYLDTQEQLEHHLDVVKPNYLWEDPFVITDVY